MRFGITKLTMTALVVAFAALPAAADFTYVSNPWNAQPGGGGGEWNLFNNGEPGGSNGIMEYLYGEFTRIDDSFDQVWRDGTASVTVEAKYAGYTQHFGWYDMTNDMTNDASHDLLVQSGTVSPIIGSGASVTFDVGTGIDFAWFDDTTASGGGLYYSEQTLNPLGNDHMVTFMIEGAYDFEAPGGPIWEAFEDGPRYVIGFEDLNLGDQDYNDLVVEVTTVRPVPVPAAWLLGAAGLGLVGWLRSRAA